MLTNLIIRRALLSDIDILITLLQSLFQIETDFTVDREKQRRGLEILLRDEERCCVLVAEIDKEIVGMCTAQLHISTAEGGLKAIIEDVIIAEGYRQQGLGQQILAVMETWAFNRRAKRLDLLADQRNIPALRFYEKNNWAPTQLICLQKQL